MRVNVYEARCHYGTFGIDLFAPRLTDHANSRNFPVLDGDVSYERSISASVHNLSATNYEVMHNNLQCEVS